MTIDGGDRVLTSTGAVLLGDLLGRPVRGADDGPLGRVVDLVARLEGDRAVVRHLVVRRRGRTGLVDLLRGTRLPLRENRAVRPAVADGRPVEDLAGDEVLLRRDVLDSQVVDLEGHRLRRVADVVLSRGGDAAPEVLAVDVGLGGLLRRLGLRRTGDRRTPVLLRWGDLHLTSGRGHLAQLATAGSGLRRLDPAGLAELLARLSAAQAVDVLGAVDVPASAAALAVSHPTHQRRLLHLLDDDEVASVIAAAPRAGREGLRAAARAPSRRRHLRTSGWRVHGPRAAGRAARPRG